MITWFAPLLLFVPLVAIEAFIFGRKGRDTWTNVGVYVGYLAIVGASGIALYTLYLAAHEHAFFDLGPWWMDPGSPMFYASWLALWVLDDLTFYAFHRFSHRLRVLWASHVTHHSSQQFDLSVGLRQTWTPFVAWPFWAPLCLLGFDPIMVITTQVFSLTYQALLHTEVIDYPRWFGLVFNTPKHHRVHHGANAAYVDKNFGGVLIVWDRLFKTFAPLVEAPQYGVGRSLPSKNPAYLGLHGWLSLIFEEKSS